jgi:Tol biopolymer transport system component
MFWAQTLPSPSADGKRICFNSNRSGTIDLCLLFLDPSQAIAVSLTKPSPANSVSAAEEIAEATSF